jgi:hypothetical protein
LLGGADSLSALCGWVAVEPAPPAAHSALAEAAAKVWQGQMEAVLSNEAARSILQPLLAVQTKEELDALDFSAALQTSLQAHLAAAATTDPLLAEAQVLLLAVAALQDFLANNYTGPPTKHMEMLQQWPAELQEYVQEWSSHKLRLVSPLHIHAQHTPPPHLLVLLFFFRAPLMKEL